MLSTFADLLYLISLGLSEIRMNSPFYKWLRRVEELAHDHTAGTGNSCFVLLNEAVLAPSLSFNHPLLCVALVRSLTLSGPQYTFNPSMSLYQVPETGVGADTEEGGDASLCPEGVRYLLPGARSVSPAFLWVGTDHLQHRDGGSLLVRWCQPQKF